MIKVQDLNSDTYTIAVDATSKAATLDPAKNYGSNAVVILTNVSTEPVFVVASRSSMTAVFPTSATEELAGKVIPAGAVMAYNLPPETVYINAIQLTAGTGNLYVSVGEGI